MCLVSKLHFGVVPLGCVVVCFPEMVYVRGSSYGARQRHDDDDIVKE